MISYLVNVMCTRSFMCCVKTLVCSVSEEMNFTTPIHFQYECALFEVRQLFTSGL